MYKELQSVINDMYSLSTISKFSCIEARKSRFYNITLCTPTQVPHLTTIMVRKELWGPFLEGPGNLTGPESNFGIKVWRKVGRVLTSDEVHFVSLAENFTVQFLKTFETPSRMENKTA